jgi:hypothetical protein
LDTHVQRAGKISDSIRAAEIRILVGARQPPCRRAAADLFHGGHASRLGTALQCLQLVCSARIPLLCGSAGEAFNRRESGHLRQHIARPAYLAHLEAQGYVRYVNGLFVSVPMLSAAGPDQTRIVAADCDTKDFRNQEFGDQDLSDQNLGDRYDRETLRVHAEFGCTSVWCVTADGSHPFVFAPRIVWRSIPCFQLVYCRSIDEFVRFARPLGRFLALRGRPAVIVDANGPVAGLVGRYFLRPKYFKGTNRPRLGDLAYTEASLFGI